MPKSSELFPIAKAPTSTPTSTTDSTPPRIVLLDKPIPAIVGGKLMVNIRTLLIDDAITIVQSSTPTPTTKPTLAWVGKTPASVSTLGDEPLKIQLRIENMTSPKMSWVSKSSDSVSTLGESPIKIQVRIEE